MNPLSAGRDSASQVSSPGLLPRYNLVHSLLGQTDKLPRRQTSHAGYRYGDLLEGSVIRLLVL